ncbi:hypothetical protein DCO47_00470 [Pseudomonas sp. NDM]|nr:hypothetical protein DCO47_00470 [Pseudomonas sp. NDM]
MTGLAVLPPALTALSKTPISLVGVSLLAIALCQSQHLSPDTPPSRAGSLLQFDLRYSSGITVTRTSGS